MRLKKGWEFDAVFRTGRHIKGALVRIIFLSVPGERTRFGMAVSKRIAGSVGRSRGKRIMREAVRRIAPRIDDGWWIVVSMRDRGLCASSAEMTTEIASLLSKAGIAGGAPLDAA